MEGLLMPLCNNVNIEEASIQYLQACMTENLFTCVELVRCYFLRINQLNSRVRAVVQTNPDAEAIARNLDNERSERRSRGPLHGIPFLVKDNISTKDRMETSCGSEALLGCKVSEEATVVARLREAGGILLGHANLSEWAAMRTSYYSEGYSARGGQTRNPCNLAENPGGTSSGSAVAVAANMCVLSLGTETDGSVTFPASQNGVIGLKPTVGLTSRFGVIPEAPSFDTIGILSRSLQDAATVLSMISGPDEHDPATLETNHNESRPDGALNPISKLDLDGVRMGLPRKRIWDLGETADNEDFRVLSRALDLIKDAGAELVDVELPSADELIPPNGWDWNFGEPNRREFTVIEREFYKSLQEYLSSLQTNPNGILKLEDIVRFNEQNTASEGGIPGTHSAWPPGQDVFEKCVQSQGRFDADYWEALSFIRRKSRTEGIDAALLDYGVDALLVPILADGGVAVSTVATAGYPMISIPAGVNPSTGVPVGLGVVHQAWQEKKLVDYGYAIENALKARSKPEFRNWDAQNYLYVGAPPPDDS